MSATDTLPNYKTHDPLGWCGDPKRGAALGRPTIHDAPDTFCGRLVLRKVRLDSGGYDENGTYFGWGPPALYWYASESGDIDAMVRADSREKAREKILEKYPSARFYR